MLEKLWDKTKEVLVIVEPGTPDGFDLVTDARAHLLSQDKNCHVAAPCPHSKVSLANPALCEQTPSCALTFFRFPLPSPPTVSAALPHAEPILQAERVVSHAAAGHRASLPEDGERA